MIKVFMGVVGLIALVTPALAETPYFRLGSGQYFLRDVGEAELPEFAIEKAAGRVDREIDGTISVHGYSGSGTLDVVDLPDGLTWIPDGPLAGVISGTVRKLNGRKSAARVVDKGKVVVEHEFMVEVYPTLSISADTGVDIEVGDTLKIVPEVKGTIRNGPSAARYGLALPDNAMPSWINFDSTTGTISGVAALAQDVEGLQLTVVDQVDFETATAGPIAIRVGQKLPPEWYATLSTGSATVDMLAESDGSAYLLAQTTSVGAGQMDMLLIKVNAAGNVAWARTYGAPDPAAVDRPYAIAKGSDGGLILYGGTPYNSLSTIAAGVLVSKISESGEVIWSRLLRSSSIHTEGKKVEVAPDGSIYLVSADLQITKLSSDGSVLWSKGFLSSLNYEPTPRNATIDGNGNLWVVGFVYDNISNPSFILKLSPGGDVLLKRSFAKLGTAVPAVAIGVQPTASGFSVLSYTGTAPYSILITQYDTKGAQLSLKNHVFTDPISLVNAEATPDGTGGYYVTGHSRKLGNSTYDLLVARFTSAGALGFADAFGPPGAKSGLLSHRVANDLFVAGTLGSTSGVILAKIPFNGLDASATDAPWNLWKPKLTAGPTDKYYTSDWVTKPSSVPLVEVVRDARSLISISEPKVVITRVTE